MNASLRALTANGTLVTTLRAARGLSRTRFIAIATNLHRTQPEQFAPLSLSTLRCIEANRPVLFDHLRTTAAILNVDLSALLSREQQSELAGIVGLAEHSPPSANRPREHARRPALRRDLASLVTRPVQMLLRATVRGTCEERYRKLILDDYDRVRRGQMSEERYWRSYWSHQVDQFLYWQDGLLETHVYRFWLRQRQRQYREHFRLKKLDYRAAWKRYSVWLAEEDFSRFMGKVLAGNLEQALRTFRKRRLRAAG